MTLTSAVDEQHTAPDELRRVADRVTVRLDAVLQAEQDRWAQVDEDLAAPLGTLRRLAVQGGKRLRPAFCEWGFRAAGGDPADEAGVDALERVGVAFELLHTFALVHDDVMDGSALRRGETTTHIEYGAHHAHHGWRGETRRFGESIAILVGDLAHVLAGRAMAEQPAPVLACWRELETELMMGQFLDVLGTARGDRSASKAHLILQLKSGRYTIERPLQIGAALAAGRAGSTGTDPEVTLALDGYGRPLGEAFQLRDDVLGVFGSPEATGKPVGDDLREGKPTLLLAYATDAASASQRSLLDAVGTEALDDVTVAALQQVLVDTGALDRVETDIAVLADQAVAAIATPSVPREVRVGMTDLAHYIAHRER